MPTTGRVGPLAAHACRRPLQAAFSPDGRRVLTASLDGTVRLWDLAQDRAIALLLGHVSHEGINRIAMSPDGRRIVTAGLDGAARLWDAATGQPSTPPLVPCGFGHAAFSPDATRIITATFRGGARLWDAPRAGRSPQPWTAKAIVQDVAFSPDGRYVITASATSPWAKGTGAAEARIWDAETGRRIGSLPHTQEILRARFSPDGRRILTAGRDGIARIWIWEVATSQLLASTERHNGLIWHAEYSPDGHRILTASDDGTARVWDAESGRRSRRR